MRIGYACLNRSVGCTANRTFRLAGYSDERLVETVGANLACLEKILGFNREHGLGYFRITSDLVPFASHPVCTIDWAARFRKEFAALGRFIRREGFRITMHPDQFTLINSPDRDIFRRSAAELDYHARVLDAMGLDLTARIQIHVGGVYGDRAAALDRFAGRLAELAPAVRRRLTVENDDGRFSLADCLCLHERTGLPVLFDVFHHEVLPSVGPTAAALRLAAATWAPEQGPLLVDYSSQEPGKRRGTHAATLDPRHFRAFLEAARGVDCDCMLEIKDKEKSALAALALAAAARRPE